MKRNYNKQTFEIGDSTKNGFIARCHTNDFYSGCSEIVCVHGITKTIQKNYNRPWQRFDYEMALEDAIKKYNKAFGTEFTINDAKRI